MTDPSAPAPGEHNPSPPAVAPGPQAPVPQGVWTRLKQHKVAQWTLAYGAAAYTLLHGAEMVSEAMDWPHLIARVLTLVLVLGVPVVITLAWYHGARHAHRVSGPELTIITILLIIAGSVLWTFTRRSGEHATSPAAATTVAAPPSASTVAITSAAPRTSVAVMPFANLTGDASKEYLGDGIAEEVINTLAQVPGLKVPARTSSFAYKGRNTDIRQICRDLGVGTILEGSVHAAGKRIRITAQLISAEDGLHIWSHTYDEQLTDLFKLQDELANAIVQALQVNLNAASPASVTPTPPTQDPEAYRLYLQARPDLGTSAAQSMRLLDEAITRDPKFARAIAEKADVYLISMLVGSPLPAALAQSERYAQEALRISPDLADGHAALGSVNAYRGEWLQAESHFREALRLDASDGLLRLGYATIVLESAGHMRQALQEMRSAYSLAPAFLPVVQNVAAAYSFVGMDSEALKYADVATKLDPASQRNTLLPLIYVSADLHRGRFEAAAHRMLTGMPPDLFSPAGTKTINDVFAAFGNPAGRAAAARSLTALVAQWSSTPLDPVMQKNVIWWYTRLDDLDSAFRLANGSLDAFARSGTIGSAWGLFWLPDMRPFRQDPRFQAFVARLSFMDYWNQYGPPDDCELRNGKLTCH